MQFKLIYTLTDTFNDVMKHCTMAVAIDNVPFQMGSLSGLWLKSPSTDTAVDCGGEILPLGSDGSLRAVPSVQLNWINSIKLKT